jgi:hypothetical protein
MNTMMSAMIKWASWTFSTITILMILIGFYGYLMGNIQVFGVRYGTYILFSQYMFYVSALFILLSISLKDSK